MNDRSCTVGRLCLLGAVVMSLMACRPYSPVRVYQNLDTLLTSGRVEAYGAFYAPEGISYPVFSLDLYGQGIGLNDKGAIEGKGTNLYLSDIFVPEGETRLVAGTYSADSVAKPMIFLRGMNYDGNYGGSYVLLVGESSYTVHLIHSAEMQVAYSGDTLILDGQAVLDKNKTYPFHFRGVLPTVNRERDENQLMHKVSNIR